MDLVHIGRGDGFSGGSEVERLPAHHASGSDAPRHLRDRPDDPVGRHPGDLRVPRKQLEGERVQRVAGQQGDGVAVEDVTRGAAPPGGRIIHHGEIVVNERVGVNQFDRACGGKHRLRGHPGHLRALEHQDRPEAFSAGEQTVTHRLEHPMRWLIICGHELIERLLDRTAMLPETRVHRVHGVSREG